MGLFQEREGDVVVMVEGGVYRQTPLYSRDGHLYAKSGGGFVRLYADGSTSKAKCRTDALHTNLALAQDKLGRLCDAAVPGTKPLAAERQAALLEGPK